MKKLLNLFLIIASLWCVAAKYVKYPVNDTGVYLSPFFLPRLMLDKSISFTQYTEYIDQYSEYGNTIRVFAASVTLPWTAEGNRHPYEKVGDKFDLDVYCKVWYTELYNRIKYFVDKDGVVIVTLIDGCSLHKLPNGWWSKHFWNGNNNLQGTMTDPEDLYRIFKPMKKHSSQHMTAYYVMDFITRLVQRLETAFPGHIVYDFNEFKAPVEWYVMVDQTVFEPLGIPRERKMFSCVDGDPGRLINRYIWQVHQVNSLHSYFSIRRKFYWKIGISADGNEAMSIDGVRKLITSMLRMGDIAIENNRLARKEQCGLACHIDWALAKAMLRGYLDWRDK